MLLIKFWVYGEREKTGAPATKPLGEEKRNDKLNPRRRVHNPTIRSLSKLDVDDSENVI